MPPVKQLKAVVPSEDVVSFDETLTRNESVYVALLHPSLTVATPTSTLLTSLAPGPEDEDPQSFALLKVNAASMATLKAVEDAALEACFKNKATWFREDLDDETLRASFKSFLDEDAKTVKVRVSEGVAAFDTDRTKLPLPAEGAKVKAVLELSRLTFGKTECGLVWTLRQVKVVGESRCLFDEDVGVDTLAETLADTILAAVEVDDIDVVLET